MSEALAHGRRPRKALWYHIADLPNWQEHAEEQLRHMVKVGLWSQLDHIHFQLHYTPDSFEDWVTCYHPFADRRVTYTLFDHSVPPLGEVYSMAELGDWCREQQGDWAILRYHNKGITKRGTHVEHRAREWMEYYQYWCVSQWRLCYEALSAGFNTVGANWHPSTESGVQGHWSGNIWWARSDWLREIPPLTPNPERSQLGGYSPRHDAELWMGTHSGCENRLELHHYEHGCVYNVDPPRNYRLGYNRP